MRLWPAFAWLLCVNVLFSQPAATSYKECEDASCRVSEAIRVTESYLEADDLESAQKWLNAAKKENPNGDNVNAYLIHSLQSEIFYYLGLYEFGVYEAQKGVRCAESLNDSLLLADGHFFKGINYFEMPNNSKALGELYLAEKYYPLKPRRLSRTIITEAHIYNNIAQVRFKLGQSDSAIFYNRKAYNLAIKNNYLRVISNAEQIFGMMFLEQGQTDSAKVYLQRSVSSATRKKFYDVGLLSTGYLMRCYPAGSDQMNALYANGEKLMASHKINSLYKKYFLEQALRGFQKSGNQQQIIVLQQQLLAMNRETDAHENYYIQHIIDRYIQSENKLLVSQINDLNQQKNIGFLQLVAALLGIVILLAAVIIIRRKNKLQQSLLDQKNEISKDLHDDIGSELSSILINANLLIKNYDTTDRQKLLLDKISQTSTEISQRLNTFIWSLNNENNNVGNFCEYVHQYGSKLFEGSDISFQYSVTIEGVEHRQLNGYFRKNLFFCVKETLNNAVKHSAANEIVMKISATDKKGLHISIADNGSGLQRDNSFGNGLLNIQKRVETLNGTVHYENDNGLAVVFSVPFPMQ